MEHESPPGRTCARDLDLPPQFQMALLSCAVLYGARPGATYNTKSTHLVH
jgi:hypothetical protein